MSLFLPIKRYFSFSSYSSPYSSFKACNSFVIRGLPFLFLALNLPVFVLQYFSLNNSRFSHFNDSRIPAKVVGDFFGETFFFFSFLGGFFLFLFLFFWRTFFLFRRNFLLLFLFFLLFLFLFWRFFLFLFFRRFFRRRTSSCF